MTDYAAIRAAVDAAEAAGLPAPKVDLTWHDANEETAAGVVRAFPARRFAAHESGAHEWVSSSSDAVDITAFLLDPERVVATSAPRANAVLAGVTS